MRYLYLERNPFSLSAALFHYQHGRILGSVAQTNEDIAGACNERDVGLQYRGSLDLGCNEQRRDLNLDRSFFCPFGDPQGKKINI